MLSINSIAPYRINYSRKECSLYKKINARGRCIETNRQLDASFVWFFVFLKIEGCKIDRQLLRSRTGGMRRVPAKRDTANLCFIGYLRKDQEGILRNRFFCSTFINFILIQLTFFYYKDVIFYFNNHSIFTIKKNTYMYFLAQRLHYMTRPKVHKKRVVV